MARLAGNFSRRLRVVSFALGVSVSTSVAGASLPEYDVKAALLFNLAKFVEWPDTAFANAGAALFVCVVGKDPFGSALDKVSGRTVRGHPISVARHASHTVLESDAPCHIVFVSAALAPRIKEVLATVLDTPRLTVADFAGFAENGGMINLVTVEQKVRFRINAKQAQAAGLKLSARLLQLATIVE